MGIVQTTLLAALPGVPAKKFLVSEVDWYDRIVFALDHLCRGPGVKESKVLVGDSVVACIGNDPQVHGFFSHQWKEAPQEAKPVAWAYVFKDLKDPEYLRRLNEYPDETTLADLSAPFTICCEETSSFITVNADYRFPPP